MKSWSHSRYDTWSKCPYRAKLQYVDRLPIPPNPHADRGTMLHSNAQEWVEGKHDDLHVDLMHFHGELGNLREMYKEGKVVIEQEWAWTHSFSQFSAWDAPDAWVRMKLDFKVKLDPTTALVIDLKSGKQSGNEIKHTEQGQLYVVGTALVEPEVDTILTEFWYIDQKDSMTNRYSMPQAADLMQRWIDRGTKATTGPYLPRPNIFTCKWCPFRQVDDGGDGKCEYAVKIVSSKKKPSSGFFDFKV